MKLCSASAPGRPRCASALEWVGRARRFKGMSSPKCTQINPLGVVSTPLDGDLVWQEEMAILLHLVDKRPKIGLGPTTGRACRIICTGSKSICRASRIRISGLVLC